MLPLILAIRRPITRQQLRGTETNATFDQLIDHNHSETGTFKQKFVINNQYGGPDSPIILEISGESDGYYVGGVGDFEETLAKEFNCTVVTLQHRFYGESYPFEESTTENLQYLSVEQAVEDISYFVDYYKKTYKADKNKWLLYGGSYPGLLSAYTKSKFDSKFAGAISSSGVVLAQKEFTDFDKQIEISLGHQCAAACRTARRHIDTLLETEEGTQYVLNLFNANGVEPDIFRFVVGELFSIAPQYGHREALCGPMEGSLITGKDPMLVLAEFNNNFFIPNFIGKTTIANEYSTASLKDTKNKAARSWLWQTCSQLGWWQVGAGKTSLRSPLLTTATFAKQCNDVFGLTDEPDTDAFNAKWGGLDQTATNIVYLTGSQDPWTPVCITDEKVPNEKAAAHTMTGPNVGHCTDYHLPSNNDPADVKRTRQMVISLVKKWLGL